MYFANHHNNTGTKSQGGGLPGRGRALRDSEAAEMLGVSTRTLPQWRLRGQGPRFVKLGRAVRYLEADLAAYLDEQTVDPTAERP
jgi:predicted DNA-binding transcriptional regulator AlpA